MIAVRFLHHVRIEGVDYVPGEEASIPEINAASLVYAYKAVYTTGAPPPKAAGDPYPQYARDEEITALQAQIAGLGGGTGGVGSVDGLVGAVDLSGRYDPLGAADAIRDRGTHTGTQAPTTIAGLGEYIEDTVAAMLTAGANVTLTYDDTAGKINVVASGGDAELMRDTVGAALVGVNGVQVAVNDAADTITLSVTGLTIAQVTGLQTALDSKLAVTGAKATGRVPTLQADLTTVLWADVPTGSGGSDPYLVKPTAGADIGALINNALATYGAVKVAPNPGAWWNLDSPIEMDDGQAVVGFGQGTCNLRATSNMTGADMVKMKDGTASHFTLAGFQLNGNNYAARGIYLYSTAAPTAPDVSPDFVPVLEHLSVYNATSDGVWLGGSYTGGLREARLRNLLLKHNGGWGLVNASSDVFLSDITTHGNGPGGIHLVSGQAGNSKLSQCKAYYETIGINSPAVRVSITGGEIQDCATGVVLGADSKLHTTIDTCGSASTAGVKITGSGTSLNLHYVGRTPPGGSPGTATYCLEMQYGASVVGGFVNTNRHSRTNDYANTWLGANRPAAGSALTISPASAA